MAAFGKRITVRRFSIRAGSFQDRNSDGGSRRQVRIVPSAVAYHRRATGGLSHRGGLERISCLPNGLTQRQLRFREPCSTGAAGAAKGREKYPVVEGERTTAAHAALVRAGD